MPLKALLFDLDGTLVDSAPDLAASANELLARRGREPLPLAALRPHGGSGARGMLGAAFGIRPGDEGYEALKQELLDHYATRLLALTLPFAGVPLLLAGLGERGLRWGIVTNKAGRYAAPLVQGLQLNPSGGCLVAGDSTPHSKPHPAPLLEAARRLGVEPSACAYVGDDHRDMLAARAAGMPGWAATWGYLGTAAHPAEWGADCLLADPISVLNQLEVA
jgi:N-acetyl-D-muramate 6-phosphate phosphatase